MSWGWSVSAGDGIETFIARWRVSEGMERAAYAQFLSELRQLIGVEAPHPPISDSDAVTLSLRMPRALSRQPGWAHDRVDRPDKKGAFVLESRWMERRVRDILVSLTRVDEISTTDRRTIPHAG